MGVRSNLWVFKYVEIVFCSQRFASPAARVSRSQPITLIRSVCKRIVIQHLYTFCPYQVKYLLCIGFSSWTMTTLLALGK